MYIYMKLVHLKKSTMGCGGSVSGAMKGSKIIQPYRRTMGNGIVPEMYDESLAPVKPSRVLQNIKFRKPSAPKKYITFE
jgi:hypothetical protein